MSQKDPPPYPGPTRTTNQPGAQRNYAGVEFTSEIDRLASSTRQEPQGQENTTLTPQPVDTLTKGEESCDVKSTVLDPCVYYMTGDISTPTAMPAVVTATEQLLGGGRNSRAGSSAGSRTGSRPGSRASSHVGSRGASPLREDGVRGLPPSYTSPQAVPPYHHTPQQLMPNAVHADINQGVQHTIIPVMKASGVASQNQNVNNNNSALKVPSSSSQQASPHGSFKSSTNSGTTPPELAKKLQQLLLLQQQQQMQQQHIHQQQQQQQLQPQALQQQHQHVQPPSQSLRHNQGQVIRTASINKTPPPVHYLQSQGQIQGQGQFQGYGQGHIQGHFQGQGHVPGHIQQPNSGFGEGLQYSHSLRSTKSASPTPIHLANQALEIRQRGQRPSTAPAMERSLASQQYYTPSRSQPVSLRRSYEMLDRLPQTHSQPDLSRLAGDLHTTQRVMQCANNTPVISKKKLPELDHAAIATRATQMVERLSQENLSLRKELETYYNKVCKLQKFEAEIEKVHEAYETLVKHSQKRENLEKAMRAKLEGHITTLKQNHKQLKEQLDKTTRQLAAKQLEEVGGTDSDYMKQLQQKEALVNKLVMQNRELLLGRERMQLEVESQRSTLEEQRAQISILDTALTHTQTHSLKYEQELSRRRVEEEKVLALQRALSQLQLVSEKRQDIDAQLVACLRQELSQLKQQLQDAEAVAGDDDEHSVPRLLHQIQQRDEHILQLQSDMLSWEQKYLHMSALNQGILKPPHLNCEQSYDVLKESYDADKLVTDTHADRLKHLEDLYMANRRAAEAEARVNTMHKQLAEKEAMLRVLQRHPTLSRTPSIASLFSSTLHSHHQSILAASSPIPSVSPLSTSPLPSTPSFIYSNPPSGASSRQNSQLDSATHNTFSSCEGPLPAHSQLEATISVHSKSSSVGSNATAASNASSVGSIGSDVHYREVQMQLAARAAMLGSLESGSEQLKKCFWQV